MRVAIGSDHGGFKIKEYIKKWMETNEVIYSDYGTSNEESVDYPILAHAVCNVIATGESDFGILVCSSGQGMSITANRYKSIRASLCWNKNIAEMARRHNDANVLVMPGLYITEAESLEIVTAFFSSEFEGGRHQRRIDQIDKIS